MLKAITRQISRRLTECELTHVSREPIDLERARRQHREFERCLVNLGCDLTSLPEKPDLPDSVFVEDPIIVLDEIAVLALPGALSRRPEVALLADALAPFRELASITEPGTLDGGDVLRLGRTLFVGRSTRTNDAAIGQLTNLVGPLEYKVVPVTVTGCLHLKSAVTQVGEETLLINREWVDPGAFAKLHLIEVDPAEPQAANALCVRDSVIFPRRFERTRERLEKHNIDVRSVAASELAKAEGGITCCALVFESQDRSLPDRHKPGGDK